MDTTLENASLQVGIPIGWFAMPDPATSESDAWPADLTAELGFEGRDAANATASLTAALVLARSQQRPTRRYFVYLSDPAAPAVQAWAQLDLVPRREPDREIAVDTWERGARAAAQPGDVDVWHREVSRGTVHDDPAVVIHDLLTVRQADGQQTVQHRAVVTVFPALPVLIDLTLSTPYLGALPDLEVAALYWAQSIRIEAPA